MRSILILSFLFLAHHGIAKSPNDYTHPATSLSFPGTIGGMKLVEVVDFESRTPGLGDDLQYRADQMKADIYVYTGGLPSIPNGVQDVVSAHFRDVLNEIGAMQNYGVYDGLKLTTGTEETTIGEQPFLHASMTYNEKGTPKVSQVYLTGFHNHFVKVRYTYEASAAQKGEEARKALLAAVAEALKKAPAIASP